MNTEEKNTLKTEEPEDPKSRKREIVETIIYFAVVIVVCLLIVRFVAYRCVVSGPSMQHTLENNDNLIAERVSYYFHKPRRFDIVIFKRVTAAGENRDEGDSLIKRVIGLPGETVAIRDGKVHINGQVLEEDIYATGGYTSAMPEITLLEDEYFVLGDNRDNSHDSRAFGPVPFSKIQGRAWVRFWPFSRMGALKK